MQKSEKQPVRYPDEITENTLFDHVVNIAVHFIQAFVIDGVYFAIDSVKEARRKKQINRTNSQGIRYH